MLESLFTYIHLIFLAIGCLIGGFLSFSYFILVNRSVKQRQNLQRELDERDIQMQYERDMAEMARRHESVVNQQSAQLVRLETQLSETHKSLAASHTKLEMLNKLEARCVQLQTRYDEQQKLMQSERVLLDEAKKTLFKEFELSANKIFEDKHQTFQQSSKTNIELVLNPFKQQLEAFNKKVDDVYHHESSQRNQLVGQIIELQKQTQQISQEANNLASALKRDSKAQGDWGEIILERILEQSGLVKGREYDVQNSGKHDDGRFLRPDVIVHLPDNKDIIVDSKVSLKAYETYRHAETDEQRKQSMDRHVESIKKHIKSLSEKKYEQIENLRTLDFVFIFIPIESAYLSAMEYQPSLFNDAYDKNIVLVSPSSLMVALRTVETIWRYDRQNNHAEKIAASAGKLYDQFSLVMEALESLDGHLVKANEAYATVFKRFTTGKGNLLSRVDTLKKLGAKTSKKLPMRTAAELHEHSRYDVSDGENFDIESSEEKEEENIENSF